MSGMIFNDGSVVNFYPCEGWELHMPPKGLGIAGDVLPVIGWCVIVLERNQWIVETDLRPVIVMNGQLVPASRGMGNLERSYG